MAKPLLRTDKEIDEIYRRHVKTVYRVCHTFLKNRADTEDAVSDTFVNMIKSAPVFDSEEHEKAWLIRVASNVCKNFLKHWWQHRQDIADDMAKTDNAFETDSLLEAVHGLPDRYKSAVLLYYYEGYTSVQVAEILRKPQSTIRNYLSEARAILRERLGDIFNEE